MTILRNIVRYTLLTLYHVTFGLYLRIAYNLKRTPDSDPLPKGPFVMLGNHCNNFDGPLLQCLSLRPILFVITNAVFKNRALGALLSFIGFIPKRKFSSDITAVRQIIRTAEAGGVIGIFPEGMRSWDGRTVAISSGTFKLIHLLKVPVVTAHISGSYLSGPRWANSHRRGRVEVKLTTIADATEVRSLSLREITKRISSALYHDEASWETQKQIPFRGKRLAEGFERLLYLCPECGQIGTIVTHKQKIFCTACNAEYTMDLFGRIHAVRGTLPADNAADLNAWQYARLKDYIANPPGEVLLQDECARLCRSNESEDTMSEVTTGTLALTHSALIIRNLCFRLSEISGWALNFKSGIMFHHGTNEYLIQFDHPGVSIHKWGCALEIITGSRVG